MNDIPIPERAGTPPVAEQASVPRVPEPSMFDAPEWMQPLPSGQTPEGLKFAGVRFQPVGKVYHYLADNFELRVGDWVVVDSARGRQMGQVASLKPPRDTHDLSIFKRVERKATGRDMAMRHFYDNKELEAMIACRAESSALGLPIKIVKAEYSFDGQTLTFLYSSDQEERVETNELRLVMSRLYRARIETRQVSPREVAKIIGGMGACGIEQRCCSRFLTDFSPISIKHAKEQGLSLNPHDITGMCGRLRCCLIYEYEQYVEARRHLPKKNAIIGSPQGQGKVVDVLPMRDSVVVLIGEGETAKQVVIHREQIVPLEELKRLQEKAASGTCDKHEGGGCDCGKNKQPAEASAQPASASLVIAQAASPEAVAPVAPGQPKKKHKKKHKPAPGAPGATQPVPPQLNTQPEADLKADAPHGHKRFPPHGKHPPSAQRADSRPPERAQPRHEDEHSTDDAINANTSKAAPPRPMRRPLRRPIQHKPPET
jgi:cell fate regulator YaaT (PSP1 superfamily)